MALLCSYCYQSVLSVCMWDYTWEHVCVLKLLCLHASVVQKQDCGCSFVAHSCPTLGISHNSPGRMGFSEALLIGCNLLFKLESQQPSSHSLQAINARNTNIAGHNWCISSCGSLLSDLTPVSEADWLLLCHGPRCKQLLSSGAFWGRRRGGGIWSESWSVRRDDGGFWGSERFPW